MRLWVVMLLVAGAVSAASAEKLKVGQPFPDFEGEDILTGQKFKLSEFRGKVVIVDFWATWCAPCVKEMPMLRKLYEQHREQGLEIIGVSLDRSIPKARQFVERDEIRWRHIADGRYWNAVLARRFDIRRLPMTFVIARDGTLLHVDLRGEKLATAVVQALTSDPSTTATAPTSAPATTEVAVAAGSPLEEALASADKQAEDWLSLARGMAANHNYALARRYYSRLIETFPDAPAAKTAQAELVSLPKE